MKTLLSRLLIILFFNFIVGKKYLNLEILASFYELQRLRHLLNLRSNKTRGNDAKESGQSGY